MNLFCQKNERTNTIISNQRFLFGTKENRKAFRVFGDGVKNFLNSITDDDMSPSVIELTIGGSYISPEVDDIENGIANRFLDSFSVKIDGGDFSDIVGTTKAMTATATSNGATINGVPFTWTSSNPLIATIDSDGNMELLAVGSATITCQIGINNLVRDTISVTVSDIKQDDYDVVYTPVISSIDEGTTQTFTVTLNKNNISTAESFSFAIVGTVPATHYIFSIIDGNSFSIKNILEYYNSPLIIRCTSGSYSKDISISLNGRW